MERQSNTYARTEELRPAALVGELAAVFVGLLLALECVTACVLLVRRAQGAMAVTASPGWLFLWMALAVAVTIVTRLAVGRNAQRGNDLTIAVARYLPALALVLTALALTSFRAPWVVVLLWAMVAAEEAVVGLALREGLPGAIGRFGFPVPRGRPTVRTPSRTRAVAPSITEHVEHADAVSEPAEDRDAPGRDAVLPSAQFAQRLERVRSVRGADLLAGTLTTRFVPGQVTAHVHVAFCPPFSRVPQLDFRQVAGPAARVKVGQVLPHGVRFDVKLEGPAAEPATLCLEMRATDAAESTEPVPRGNSASNQ